MVKELHQGDVLKVERLGAPVLVVSQELFNEAGQIIGCPILTNSIEGPLHIYIATDEVEGYVQCENLKLLDMNVRGYTKCGNIDLEDKINISDTIQGIFDYL